MPDPTKPPDWMAHQVMAQLDGVFPSAAEMHDAAVLAHYERRLTEDAATIADLRDRLRVMGCHLCRDCGCAPRDADMPRCWDCDDVRTVFEDRADPQDSTPASAVVVGLRALCGRRILEGC